MSREDVVEEIIGKLFGFDIMGHRVIRLIQETTAGESGGYCENAIRNIITKALDRLAAPPAEDVRELASMLPRKAVYIPIPHGVWNSAAAENMLESFRARILDEAADRVWPLLKQEYEWRHEDSECGGDETSEGLDMLKDRLLSAMRGEDR